jgi:ATP-dependent Clp protease ATP-binding subunit ClpC
MADSIAAHTAMVGTALWRRGHRHGIVSGVFENFNHRGRQVVVRAQDQARGLKHHYIGTEHLLLGVFVEDGGAATQSLHAYGLTLDRALELVVEIVGPGPEAVVGQMPFTPRANGTLRRANRVRLSLGNQAVAPEHLLMALDRETAGIACKVLDRVGVDDNDALRKSLIQAIRSSD